jgi:hypothetical protein
MVGVTSPVPKSFFEAMLDPQLTSLEKRQHLNDSPERSVSCFLYGR